MNTEIEELQIQQYRYFKLMAKEREAYLDDQNGYQHLQRANLIEKRIKQNQVKINKLMIELREKYDK